MDSSENFTSIQLIENFLNFFFSAENQFLIFFSEMSKYFSENVIIEKFYQRKIEILKGILTFNKIFFILENLFFRPKKKSEKNFESLYRCKISRRIHFSHLQGNLSCVWFPNSALKSKTRFSPKTCIFCLFLKLQPPI